MRNIININYQSGNNGTLNSAYPCNELILYIQPASMQKSNFKVEITDISGNVHESEVLKLDGGLIIYTVDSSYWNGEGIMKIRLLSSEGESGYTNFVCVAFNESDNMCCKYKYGNFVFSLYGYNSGSSNMVAITIAEIDAIIASVIEKE